ncbi:hypothetical protein OPQ81_001517 [Rhizoctonia solani]|nr:hypothetical protein OPQ81_001517 [Rhizoctonia solani]
MTLLSSRTQEQADHDEGDAGAQESSNSVYAALARTAARGASLYFSRPMRLFRPTKISGWTTLRHAAVSEGKSLSPAFVTNLIRTQGALVIPRHFIPPLLVNTCLGTILFSTYTYVYDEVHREIFCSSSTAASAIAGATAGAVQSIVGAPAENIQADPKEQETQKAFRREARATREWMREVSSMSMSRGWEGWGWSCAKDTLGFALFFATFDVSRHFATRVSHVLATTSTDDHGSWKPLSGGIGHEFVGRPFDTARRILHIHNTHIRAESARQLKTHHYSEPKSSLLHGQVLRFGSTSINVLRGALREEGLLYFFRSATPTSFDSKSSPYQRLQTALRTLGRVGPWGIAFVVWEATGGVDT